MNKNRKLKYKIFELSCLTTKLFFMKTLFSSILLLLATISTAQFKIPKKVDWEIANTKPILLLQLPDSDPNAQIFNSSLKIYVEQYFGASRISQYLQPKEF